MFLSSFLFIRPDLWILVRYGAAPFLGASKEDASCRPYDLHKGFSQMGWGGEARAHFVVVVFAVEVANYRSL